MEDNGALQDETGGNVHGGETSGNQVSASDGNGSHEQPENKRKCCIKRWEEIHKEKTKRDNEEAKEKMGKRLKLMKDLTVQSTESGDYYMFIDETKRKQIMGSDDENMKMHKLLQLVGFDL
uniref:Uncharacterized protein n=1 Tax=Ciona intestinalis TaxID=7719 RepID=H2XKA8_CIOIN